MIRLKRSKHNGIVFVTMLLGFSVWSLVNTVRVFIYCSPETRNNSSIQNQESVNVAGLPEPTHPSKEELIITNTEKPKIDMVNGYYPFVDFKFVFPQISPKVDRTLNMFMMIVVNYGAKGDKYRKLRDVVRQTWGNQSNCEQRKALRDEKLKDLRWLVVFIVGKAGPGTNDDELNVAEAAQHNDMLIGNITDNYINNIIKLYMGLVWASRFDIKYILKADDDVYVRIPRVVEFLVSFRLPTPFYGGWVVNSQRVNRRVGKRWAISWKYYGELKFPRFNTGAFIILSSDLLYRLFNYVNVRKPFHVDDAYLGVAMRDFGVKEKKIRSFILRHDINTFVRKVDDCKLLGIVGFSHPMQPESTRFLHDRLSLLACENTKIQQC